MKLVWSPESASNAFIDTVKSCQKFNESSVAEILSAMAAGWRAKLIVESWSRGGAVAASVGLAVAARHVGARHVCIVPDEASRAEYVAAMLAAGTGSPLPEVVVGAAEAAMAGLAGVEFLVVDCKREEFSRILKFANLSKDGAVLMCKNIACREHVSGRGGGGGFRWSGVLGRGTRVVRSVFLPVGRGLDIVHVAGSSGGGAKTRKGLSRWIRHVDLESGEEHVFRNRG